MSMGLTHRQTELLDFLRAEFARHGVYPRYRKIAKAMGWNSAASAHEAVETLIARGYIRKRLDGRGIELVEPVGDDPRNCFCDWCNTKRIRAHQTFIEALSVQAPILDGTNFKALGLLARTCWRIGFPKPAHPETRKPQAHVHPSQVSQFHEGPQSSSKSGTIKAGCS